MGKVKWMSVLLEVSVCEFLNQIQERGWDLNERFISITQQDGSQVKTIYYDSDLEKERSMVVGEETPKPMTQEEIKTLHYALFWLKDCLSSNCLDKTYRETSMSLLDTINALSEMTVRNSGIDLNLEQFKDLFKDRWQHVNFVEKQ